MAEKQEKFTLLNGRVVMKRGVYNPTSDAVWLAAYAPNTAKKILDVGIGTGGVALCLLTRNPDAQITGLDISDEMLDGCRKNMELNARSINLVNADILNWSTTETFDLVVTNPPYFMGAAGNKKNAHHATDIARWIKRSVARVKPGGHFCMIVDSLLADIAVSILVDKHFGNIQIFPLFSNKNHAERVLIRAKQGVRTGCRIYSGTNMNNESILRSGLTIDEWLAKIR